MSIEELRLVDAKEVKTTRGGGGKNKGKYTKYTAALKKIIPMLKEELRNSDTIRVKTKDVIEEMGGEFKLKHPTSLLWGIKFVMFKEGIFLTTGKHKSGDDIYILRKVVEGDKLPDSLSSKLENEKEGNMA